MPDIDKDAFKEALNEWLDKQFAAFGKWALRSIMAIAFTAVVYLFLFSQGWHK